MLISGAHADEKIPDTDAMRLGMEITLYAKCGLRFGPLDFAKLRNQGITARELAISKDLMKMGEEAALREFRQQGQMAYCHRKPSPPINLSSAFEALGMVRAKDRACGTHEATSMLAGMKERGEIYRDAERAYAKEIAAGEHLEQRELARTGIPSECREERQQEIDDKYYDQTVRSLGLYQLPVFNRGLQ